MKKETTVNATATMNTENKEDKKMTKRTTKTNATKNTTKKTTAKKEGKKMTKKTETATTFVPAIDRLPETEEKHTVCGMTEWTAPAAEPTKAEKKAAEKQAKAEARAKAKADREAKKQAEKEAKAKAKAERPVANDYMITACDLIEELGYTLQATDNDLNVKHRFRAADKNGKKQFRFDFSGKGVCTVKGTIKFEGAEYFEGKAHPYIRKNTPITKEAFAAILQALTDEVEEEAARQAEKEAEAMAKKITKESKKAEAKVEEQ